MQTRGGARPAAALRTGDRPRRRGCRPRGRAAAPPARASRRGRSAPGSWSPGRLRRERWGRVLTGHCKRAGGSWAARVSCWVARRSRGRARDAQHPTAARERACHAADARVAGRRRGARGRRVGRLDLRLLAAVVVDPDLTPGLGRQLVLAQEGHPTGKGARMAEKNVSVRAREPARVGGGGGGEGESYALSALDAQAPATLGQVDRRPVALEHVEPKQEVDVLSLEHGKRYGQVQVVQLDLGLMDPAEDLGRADAAGFAWDQTGGGARSARRRAGGGDGRREAHRGSACRAGA